MITQMYPEVSMRPPEGVAHRMLYIELLVDISGSMRVDGKIEALNQAVHNALPDIRKTAKGHPEAKINLMAISFGDNANVVVEPTPLESFVWHDIRAKNEGTNMGAAFEKAAEEFDKLTATRGYPPVVGLISDGGASHNWRPGAERLLRTWWGKHAQRVAIAIGQGADLKMLHEFMGGDPERPPLYADTPQKLCEAMRFVTVEMSQAVIKSQSQVGSSGVVMNLPAVPASLKPTGASWVKP